MQMLINAANLLFLSSGDDELTAYGGGALAGSLPLS